jgi:hypothetical protein
VVTRFVQGLVATALIFAAMGARAQDVVVEASVDRATVHENESFTYTVRAEGRAVGEPDVSFLEQQFDILNRSTATQIQLLNERTQQVAEWTYQLMPKKTGQFTLPPLQFGDVLSNAVTIEVLAAEDSGSGTADIFMEVELDPARVYVQSQAIYTLRLFIGVGTGRASMTPPPIAGGEAIVERLGEDQQYQTVRGGRNFLVRERRYAIFPQQAGSLAVGPVTFEAMVIPTRGFSRVQRLRSATVDLEVLPAVAPPPELAGASWLPAASLTLTEDWADDAEQFSLGVPRTRILTVTADGLLETQLPELDLADATGIRQYPDQPELKREITTDGLRVERVERFAVIAQAAGSTTLPAVELPWWNVHDARWEVARIEPRAIAVVPGSELDVALPPAVPAPELADDPRRGTNYWPLVSVVLGVAWLATILLWLRARKGSARHGARREPARAAAAAASRRRVLKALRAACAVDDAGRVRDLMLDWAKVELGPTAPSNLGVLRDWLPDALQQEVAALEAHLYGPRGAPWSGGRLAELITELDRTGRSPAKDGKDPLVPLYR